MFLFFFFFFSPCVKMSEKNIIFNDKRINKTKFYANKEPFNIDDVDVDKILISKKEPYG